MRNRVRLAALSLMLLGCGGLLPSFVKEQIAEEIAEEIAGGVLGGEVEVNGEEVTFDNGEGTQMRLSNTAPAELLVPPPPGGRLAGSSDSVHDGTRALTVAYETTASLNSIREHYQKAFATLGATPEEMGMAGMGALVAEVDGWRLQVSVLGHAEARERMVQIMQTRPEG